ncbi:hypothetical protein LWE61_09770 [Sphingobium sufflavum]|uniref:hypothetical protein n=1 Tax=Sphingobium sufflavum TaxID=1129547 RepID=UPI001F21740D|nr:hypothetical protein [Sphingobium sufflavum]MCE7796844.1 hypothetical protein [Sphingobium sufflavum]
MPPRSALLPLMIPFCLLAACDRTPSFEKRYEEQTATLKGSANSIERELANQISGADAAARAEREISNAAVP